MLAFNNRTTLAYCKANYLSLECNNTFHNLKTSQAFETSIQIKLDICREDMFAITNITSSMPTRNDDETRLQNSATKKHLLVSEGQTSYLIDDDIYLDFTFRPIGRDGFVYILLKVISKNISVYGFRSMILFSGGVDDKRCNVALFWFKTKDNLTTLIVGFIFLVLVVVVGFYIMKRKQHPLPPMKLELVEEKEKSHGTLTVIEEIM